MRKACPVSKALVAAYVAALEVEGEAAEKAKISFSGVPAGLLMQLSAGL